MDSSDGIVGAFVIASRAYGLVRDTGAILLDVKPDRKLPDRVPDPHRERRRLGDGPPRLPLYQ